MREVLEHVLGGDDDVRVDRILAAAFFRKRPLQAGVTPNVVHLADRAKAPRSTGTEVTLSRGR